MTAAESKLRAALAAPALALALFQCWYAYLPEADAVAFHHCRFNAHLDCYKSLSMRGAGLKTLGVSVLAAITATYLAMTLLLAAAPLASEPKRTGLRAWAALLAFPALGLSAFVLLKDVQDGVTSLSTLIILGLGLALCALTVVKGIPAPSLRPSAAGFAGALAVAAAAGWLVQGTGSAKLDLYELQLMREGQPAQLRWPRFAHGIPRVGAAHLGDPKAPRELLLFVDPQQAESQRLMRQAASLALGDRVVIFLYAPTDPRLLDAHRRGRLQEFIKDPGAFANVDGPDEWRRQNAAIGRAGIGSYPQVWTREGRGEGAIDLAEAVRALRGR